MTFLLRLADNLRHRARLRRSNPDHALGRRGEDLAHRFLRRHGFQIVARNYRKRHSNNEIDLIAWDGNVLVFVEVKTRTRDDFGLPEDAVDAAKRQGIVRAAGEYLRRSNLPWDAARFDIVSIKAGAGEHIRHLRGAFSPSSL